MAKDKKTEMIKIRVTPKEKRTLESIAHKEDTAVSILIRNRIFVPEKSQIHQMKKDVQLKEKKLEASRVILSDLCSSINQFDAGIDRTDAFKKIKQGVNELCRIFN